MEKLVFSVDSALLSELGEKLVESVHIALLELVKNAYDADATFAKVKVLHHKNAQYKIIVEDDGEGMTLNDVKRYWMRIATTNKALNRTSEKYGRTKSGSKGIGRFSCRRLGKNLALMTTALLENGQYETTCFKVDWSIYRPGTDIAEITCDSVTTHSAKGTTGTQIEIIGAQSGWGKIGWGVLKRRLMLLIINRGSRSKLPNIEDDPGFSISLEAPDFEEEGITNPREQLMNSGWGRLTLTVNEAGQVHWNLIAKDIGKKNITMGSLYPELAGTTADIAILPQVKDQFRNPNLIGITSLQDALDEWGGVFIRADGVRVFPFGDKGNDWLHIDLDRGRRLGKSSHKDITRLAESLIDVEKGREILNLLSAKNHVGEVQVESPINLFEMKASREGFVGHEPIEILREITRFGIDWATVYRDYYLRRNVRESYRKARDEFRDIIKDNKEKYEDPHISATKYLDMQIRELADTLPEEKSVQLLNETTKAIKLILETEKTRSSELQHLRLVAATSSLFLVFQHEVKSLLSALGLFEMNLQNIDRRIKDPAAKKSIREMIDSFATTKSNFDNLLSMTSLLSTNERQDTPKKLDIAVRAKKAVECFRLISSQYDININLSDIERALKVGPMLEAELFSIFLNALSNAIKSVIAAGTKNIKIEAHQTKTGLVKINIMDSGLGVDSSDDDLFLPFIADPHGILYSTLQTNLNPEDRHIVGSGSGLGLSIIRDIAVSHGGNAKFTTPQNDKWTCNLEVTLK